MTTSVAPGAKTLDRSATSMVRQRLLGFGVSGLVRSWYSTSMADDPLRPVAEVEHERGVEGAEAVQVGGIEAARRVREADLGDGAGRVRPPGVDGPVGQLEVGGQVAEEVERHRRRPQEVGPQSLVVEALVRLDRGRSRPRRVERAGGEEVRAGLTGVVEREAAADGTRRLSFTRNDRLRSDRVAVRLTPPRLLVAQPPAELGHLRPTRHAVVGFPTVRGLEFPL